MCTVTFIKDYLGGYILTSNRDEKKIRETLLPENFQVGNHQVLYPQDKLAGGTWISMGTNGIVCCLLNGAFTAHERIASYKKSRGQVLLDVYRSGSLDEFTTLYDFREIEPFTLILFDMQNDQKLTELRWDGSTKHIQQLDANQHHIWSSATLYSSGFRKNRTEYFEHWSKNLQNMDENLIFSLHSSTDQENGFILKGEEGIETVSITQLHLSSSKGAMNYYETLNKQTTTKLQPWKKILQL